MDRSRGNISKEYHRGPVRECQVARCAAYSQQLVRKDPARFHALLKKAAFEVRYPRVIRYSARIRNSIRVNWDEVPALKLDPQKIPPEVEVKSLSVNNAGRLSLAGPGAASQLDLQQFRASNRVQTLLFQLASTVTRDYLVGDNADALPSHVLFPQVLAVAEQYVREKVVIEPPNERVDLFLSPYYAWVVERLVQAIRPDTSEGEGPEIARNDDGEPGGSTAKVRFWTSRPVYPVNRCHVNGVVADTQVWEQSGAYRIDRHGFVKAFMKNAGLGFEVPYYHDGTEHGYLPDFLVRLADGTMLILEVKGYDPLEEVKKAAAMRWVSAVNAEGSKGRWRYAIAHSPGEVDTILNRLQASKGETQP